jgi:hypothetical protein
MVGLSEGSLVANLKNWARRPTRKERIVADQHPTTADEAEQSQRTPPPVVQHLAMTVEDEQSQRASTASQPLATTADSETEQNQGEFMVVAPKIATERTSFVAQYPATTPD